MFRQLKALHPWGWLALVCLVLLSACATTSGGSTGITGGVTGGATPTATAIPCATHATTTALVYADGPNVAGIIPAPAAPPTSPLPALSNFSYPLGIPDENAVGNAPSLSFSAFAPDGTHLAVAVQQLVPFTAEYDPYIVDTSTHAVTKVPLSQPITIANSSQPVRSFAWADAHTLIVFANPPISNRTQGATTTFSYNITNNTLTPLPGVTSAVEGVVRCSTLFYLTLGSFTAVTPADPNHTKVAPTFLNRYDLGTHTAIGNPINIGQASTFAGAEGAVDFAGWDASPDGSRIVYQHEAVTGGPTITSTWFVANANGSGASAILPQVTSNSGARMAISPDGTQVAVTNANPSPNVVSGPLSGGTGVFYDTPSGDGQPAWLPNGRGFFASSVDSYTPVSVMFYSPCGNSHCNGSPVVAKANNPATLT